MKRNLEFSGLTDKQVLESREQNGSNQITVRKKDGFFMLLLQSLGDPIIKILLIALGIKTVFLMKDFDWFETVGIVIAIFLASFISSISEYGSEKAFEKLQEDSSKIKCRVKRNGKKIEVPIDDIVVGDLVLLESGDKIPADGNLIEGEITVDESSLNGETKEATKVSLDSVYQEATDKNIVYRGTVVYSKTGIMQVTKVGDDTFYGKLAREVQEKQPDSPLKLRLRGLASTISKIGYFGALLVSFSYLFSTIVIDNQFQMDKIVAMVTNFPVMSGHILYALTLSVTIIVVAVPEGLPMMITLVLSSNMKRMLKEHVLVRKLVGIETAGSLNILFTDKTGTLTKGKLEVIRLMSGSMKEYNVEAELGKYKPYQELVRDSVYYNNASSYDASKKQIIGGNITDRALLQFINPPYQFSKQVVGTVPFDSKNKYSSATIRDGVETIHYIKGAPEKIIPKCTEYYDELGKKRRIVSTLSYLKKIDDMTKNGIRVLALATAKKSPELPMNTNLVLVGIVFIKDEIRKEAIEGIELVHQAHIQTVMITGDNKDTATSIAKEVGLLKKPSDLVLTSDELNRKSDEELKQILPNLRVVARSLPQDKSRLVRISQELNLVVGMTGDGVNDAPALKKADVGFAMGSGTEVSKEASDIVILDDNFKSISRAILFGRTIFKSIRKFIIFQLTVNICAVSLSIIGPFIGVDTPVTVIQMLWINMVMDTLAGIAFAYEPPLLEYMKEKPKRKDEAIINQYMKDEIMFTGAYSALLCVLFLKLPWIHHFFRSGTNDKYLMTAFFGLFIFMGIFNSFNARTHRLNLLSHLYQNRAFIIIIAFILFVQINLIYFGGNLFRTFGLTFYEFIIMVLFSLTVIPVDWFRKLYLRKKGMIGGV
ncbi:MAG: calcium-translocating P-type ATPase, PMCA-type [Firmicutes bacterium]|nr:calcium-translocating P-type ATPase, PMCA-type [Bacillota bacterium]